MDAPLEYLLSFLEEEFRDRPGVRVRISPRAGTQRAADLEQDYDADSKDVHLQRGVIVRTARREYYFPVDWVRNKDYGEIQRLADQIKEALVRPF